ncbi:hypothetical protein MMC25_006468 [Agyrium rufum]|nr:hypothetical protein [Agyrium rufum]
MSKQGTSGEAKVRWFSALGSMRACEASNPPRSQSRTSVSSSQLLRRSPRFDRSRVAPARSPPPPALPAAPRVYLDVAQPESRFSEEGGGSTTTGTSRIHQTEDLFASFWPQRSLRISRRTASAILFALEEAIRTPFEFTRDLEEENASMSDLTGGVMPGSTNPTGRAQNGNSRVTAGATPLSTVPAARINTPINVLQQRRERNRKKEAEAAQQLELEREEERRRARARLSEERRAATAAGVGDSGNQRDSRETRDDRTTLETEGDYPGAEGIELERRRSNRPRSRRNPPASNTAPTYVPTGPQTTEQQPTRANTEGSHLPQPVPRSIGGSVSQGPSRPAQSAPAPAPAATPGTAAPRRRPTQTQPIAATTPAQAGPSAAPSTSQRPPASHSQREGPTRNQGGTSSFPHAFERWETLSSHWEGLTSYWIRRLENNSDENTREPLNQQLARQVTDLSAAGANLFHAVVELQRLRASSERKFQRWFFDTKEREEAAFEKIAELENALKSAQSSTQNGTTHIARAELDRSSAQQLRTEAEQIRNQADARIREMQRELQISKDEARRAWEELGRREQEERERTISLKSGAPTLVGGVQVVPMIGGRQTASSSRPPTRDGPPPISEALTGNPTYPQPRDENREALYTEYDPARSETDTDPFTETGRGTARLEAPPLPASAASTAATHAARAAAGLPSATPQRGGQTSVASAPGGTYLSYGPSGATQQPGSGAFYQQQEASIQPGSSRRQLYAQEADDNISEEDYELDEHGQPLVYQIQPGPISEESDDEYDVSQQLEQEQQYRQRYGVSNGETGRGQNVAVGGARPTAVYGSGSGRAAVPDYTGAAYGAGWEAAQQHHHPTRLSDVLEEDERSALGSRNSPSRVSGSSRGYR